MPGLRRQRIRPEDAAAARARLDVVLASSRGGQTRVVGGWTPPPSQPTAGWEPEPEAAGIDIAPDSVPAPSPVPAPVGQGLPPALHRLGLPSTSVVGLVAVAVVAVLVALGWGWYTRARPEVAAAPQQPGLTFPTPGTGAAPTPTPARVVVDVAGRVRRPGLVTLPAGARVADAVQAAGGVRGHPDLTALNLAAVLVDGQQILVGVGGGGAPAASAAGAASGAPLDLNSADATALDALPGIGPVLAQRIVDYRTAHGPFREVAQLQDVSGIGPAIFADLSPLVRV